MKKAIRKDEPNLLSLLNELYSLPSLVDIDGLLTFGRCSGSNIAYIAAKLPVF